MSQPIVEYSIEIENQDIFSDFCLHGNVPMDVDTLAKECYELRDKNDLAIRSSRLGWQSRILSSDHDQPCLKALQSTVNEFAEKALEDIGLTVKVYDSNYWVNINRNLSYNIMHHHGRTDLIAIVYIKAPNGCGKFVASRNDGSCYTNLYKKAHHQKYGNVFTYEPRTQYIIVLPGHIWHHVEPSLTEKDRIAISYNIQLHPSVPQDNDYGRT